QSEPRRNHEQADTFERVGFEESDVRGIGQALDELLVTDDLHLGGLDREFEPEEKGHSPRQAADELLVAQADAAQFARREKAGLAKIMRANIGALAIFASAGEGQHRDIILRRSGSADRRGGRIGGIHGGAYWMANSGK